MSVLGQKVMIVPVVAERLVTRKQLVLVEELRVSLFAQVVGTPRPVSEQRVYKAIDAL